MILQGTTSTNISLSLAENQKIRQITVLNSLTAQQVGVGINGIYRAKVNMSVGDFLEALDEEMDVASNSIVTIKLSAGGSVDYMIY